jgi:hypothetical protein
VLLLRGQRLHIALAWRQQQQRAGQALQGEAAPCRQLNPVCPPIVSAPHASSHACSTCAQHSVTSRVCKSALDAVPDLCVAYIAAVGSALCMLSPAVAAGSLLLLLSPGPN